MVADDRSRCPAALRLQQDCEEAGEEAMPEKTYYEILGVSRGSSLPDIEAAYRGKLKDRGQNGDHPGPRELERAYKTLRDPNLKRKYDTSLADREVAPGTDTMPLADELELEPKLSRPDAEAKPRKPGISLRLVVAGILIAIVLGLLGGLYWKFGFVLRDYSVGSRLVDKNSYGVVGTVVAKEERHVFPGGVETPAYEVRLESDGSLVWYSKAEVNQLYKVVK
jgi:hypothetical protein